MDIAALIISIISLMATTIIGIYELKSNRKINDITLEADFFDFLYKDLMIKQIPSCRAKLLFDQNNKLTGADDLIDAISEMRKKSIYYQYTDKLFYDRIKLKLQNIEDMLQESCDLKMLAEDQTDFFNNLQKEMKELYELLLKKYQGKKIE